MDDAQERLDILTDLIKTHCRKIWQNDRYPEVYALSSHLRKMLLENGFEDIAKHL